MARRRFRLQEAAMFAAIACLVLAATAGAKPQSPKGQEPGPKRVPGLVVRAPEGAKLTPGATVKVKVKVLAKGRQAIGGVVVVAKGSRGVTAKPGKVMVGRVAPGQKGVATFGVTVAASAVKPKLEFVAKAPGVSKARDRVALKVGAGKEEAKTPAIVGRYFFRSELVLNTSYLHGYYFVDEDWVYRGIPKGGLPSCSSQTAQGEDDGCLPYTWDEGTGALNIAGVGGEYKVDSHGLKVGEDAFSEAVPAEAGTKLDASGSYINQFGLCPYSCSFVTADLKMSSNGEFARASGAAGFFGEGGSYTALPPESHGTYAIDPRGRITSPTPTGTSSPTRSPSCLTRTTAPIPTTGSCSTNRPTSGHTPILRGEGSGRPG